jgi:hypothetical protein
MIEGLWSVCTNGQQLQAHRFAGQAASFERCWFQSHSPVRVQRRCVACCSLGPNEPVDELMARSGSCSSGARTVVGAHELAYARRGVEEHG